jgi:hypothetical protein
VWASHCKVQRVNKCGCFSMNFLPSMSNASHAVAVISIRFVRDLFQRPSTKGMPGRWRLPSTSRSTTASSALAATASSWRLAIHHAAWCPNFLIQVGPCLVSRKFCKIFQILRYIEILDICMKH